MAQDTRRPYSRAEFLPRSELDAIVATVKALADGRLVEWRAFSLADESGMGKTWALRDLAESILLCEPSRNDVPSEVQTDASARKRVGARLSSIAGVHSVYVDLLEWSAHFSGENEPDVALKQLMRSISLQIVQWSNAVPTGVLTADPATVGLSDFSRWLETDLRHFAREFVFVLLLDQVHEAPWKLLEQLDQLLLGPLTAIPRVLPIVAGRGQGYPFRSPEMYLHCGSIRLKPLNEKQTREQIRLQVPEEERLVPLERIYSLSGGYPRLSYAIAKFGAEAGLSAELETILAVIEDEILLKRLQEYLKAVCVLQSFDDDRALVMLGVLGIQASRTQAAEMRKALMKHSFAFWPERGKGWVLDGALRLTQERLLQLKDPTLLCRLHRLASELYEKWCLSYPRTKETWAPEAEFHYSQVEALQCRAG